MRVAIVHPWFVSCGGAERVTEAIASLFPTAEIYTLMYLRKFIPLSLRGRTIHASGLQRMPGAAAHHREMMPWYAWATERMDLRGMDLVISSDSGPVKGVHVDAGAVHVCYCHSPMRFLYDQYDSYRARMALCTRAVFSITAPRLRAWDVEASAHVTRFIANSQFVAERIRRAYGRRATVIHPPIETCRGRLTEEGGSYLCAGRMVAYKRMDLVIAACNRLGRRLRVAGTGPEERRLRRMAGPNVIFLGELSHDALWNEFARCRALIFAAEEDFGMIPLEVQACGRPVIALGAGGSLETVCGSGHHRTGIFFAEQTADSVIEGILHFEEVESTFRPAVIRAHAAHFDTSLFLAQMRSFILETMPAAAAAMIPTTVEDAALV